MTPKPKKKPTSADAAQSEGSTSRIRAVVGKLEPKGEALSIVEQIQAVQRGIKRKDRNRTPS